VAKKRKKRRGFQVPTNLGPCEGLVKIGEGAMGAVFRANHPGMGMKVAVKVLNPKLGKQDPVAVRRFVREVRSLAALHDPNVIRVFDAGQEGPYTYAIMELIIGQSLDKILKAEPSRQLSAGAAAHYLCQIARGLVPVHATGIVHRDIKPENVMVDSHGQTKIADFGLAQSDDGQNLTMADQIVGTPEYMAPELVAQKDVTGQADLYSLGITGYELLTGLTPFNRGTLLQIVQCHLRKDPVPLNVKVPSIPPGLDAVVTKLLSKDPRDRYLTAQETADALEPFADRDPPHFPQPDPEPRPASASPLPDFSELFLVKLLVRHNVYDLDTLLDGLLAWRRLPPGSTFAQFLVQRAGLPHRTAEQATHAAANLALGLRNQLAFNVIKGARRLRPEQLQAVSNELRAGMKLEEYLVGRGWISPADGTELNRTVQTTLDQGVERSAQQACQRLGARAAPLKELEALYTGPQFDQLLRLTISGVVQQL
jgi:serine/threonine protein kinase